MPMSKEEALERARKVKQENQKREQEKQKSSLSRQVQEILDTHPNEELKRKLAYAQDHITHPGMTDVRRDLLREATKR